MAERPLKFADTIEDMLELLELQKNDDSFGIGVSSALMVNICKRIKELEARNG
jgi:hypothetical protein